MALFLWPRPPWSMWKTSWWTVPIPDGVVVDRLDRIVACVGMEKDAEKAVQLGDVKTQNDLIVAFNTKIQYAHVLCNIYIYTFTYIYIYICIYMHMMICAYDDIYIYAYDDICIWWYMHMMIYAYFQTKQCIASLKLFSIYIYAYMYCKYMRLVFFTAWQHPKLSDFLRFVQLLGGRFL